MTIYLKCYAGIFQWSYRQAKNGRNQRRNVICRGRRVVSIFSSLVFWIRFKSRVSHVFFSVYYVFFTMIFIKLSSLIICPTRDNYTIEWDFYRTRYFLGTNDINFKIKRLLVEFVDNDIKKTLFMKNAEKTMNYWNN